MTKKRSSEFFRDKMKIFREFIGERSREGNLWVEMCSHKFFLIHALIYVCINIDACVQMYPLGHIILIYMCVCVCMCACVYEFVSVLCRRLYIA